MDRDNRQNSFKQPYVPRPHPAAFLGKIANPEVKNDQTTALLLQFQNGQISSIIDFIRENKVNIDFITPDNETVLHYLLRNDQLAEKQKIDVMNLIISTIGKLPFSYNKQNITPLHIAIAKQSYQISHKLIKAGHSVNSVGYGGKTPLHYAVTGVKSDCPKKEKLQVVKPKTKKEAPNFTVFMDEMVKYMQADPTVKQFMEHFINTAYHLDDIMKDDFIKIRKKIDNELGENAVKSANDEKKVLARAEIIEKNRKMLIEDISSKLKTTLSKINTTDSPDGWGPTPTTPILEVGNLKYFYNDLSKKTNDLKQKVLNDFNENIATFMENENTLASYISDIVFIVKLVAYMVPYENYYFTKFQANNLAFDENDVIVNAAGAAVPVNDFRLEIVNIPYPPPLDLKLKPTVANDLLKIDNTTTQINTCGFSGVYSYELGNTIIEEDKLTIFNSNPHPYDPRNARTSNGIFHNAIQFSAAFAAGDIFATFINMPDRNPFVVKIMKLDKILKQLITEIMPLRTDLVTDNLNYEELCRTYLDKLIRIIECIHHIKLELNVINNKVRMIIEKLEELKVQHTDEYIISLYKKIIGITKSKIRSADEINSTVTNLYKIVLQLHSVFDKYIILISYKSAFDYNNQYFNRQLNDNNFDVRLPAVQYRGIINRPISLLPILPEDIDKYSLNRNDDVNANVKMLIEKYAATLTKYNFFYNLINLTGGANINSVSGYFIDNDFTTPPVPLVRPPNPIKNPLQTPILIEGYVAGELEPCQNNRTAVIGQKAKVMNPNKEMLPIGYPFFDEHFTIIKYYIVRHLLNSLDAASKAGLLHTLIIDVTNKILDKDNSDRNKLMLWCNAIDDIIQNAFKMTLATALNSILKNTRDIPDVDLSKVTLEQVLKVDNKDNDRIKSVYEFIKENSVFEDDIFIPEVQEKKANESLTYDIMDPNKVNCYYTDDRIIEDLIKKGADINAQDNLGNTPLHDAVMMGNKLAIKVLKKNNADVGSIKNTMGRTVNDLVKSHIDKLISNNLVNNILLEKISDKMNKDIKDKTKVDVTMRFNNIIPKMLLYMVNHQMYLMAKRYPRFSEELKWSFDDQKNLEEMMKVDGEELMLIRDPDLKILNNYDIYETKYRNYTTTQNEKRTEKIKSLRFAIENLTKQKNGETHVRQRQIDDEIIELINQVTRLETTITNTTTDASKVNMEAARSPADAEINKLRDGIPKSDNVSKIYDKIYDNSLLIINNRKNHRLYPMLWSNYFLNVDPNDKTQLLSKVLEKLKEESIDPLCLNYILIMGKFIDDYFELPIEYNASNYMLKKMLDILTHITSHTICTNLYHVIIKILKNHLTTIKKYKTDNQADQVKLDQTIYNIIESSDDLTEYIFKKFPKKCVKIILGIYENDNDGDKETALRKYFDEINKKLMGNTVESINKDSPVIKTLNESIYKYFMDYLETVIKFMKLFIDGYFKVIKTISEYSEIAILVAA
uniref:Ankyrin repeat protein n=1 Tax=viral metagenome TaxID=1070528 RepID=A0A6C0EA83_9ZZZZ